MYGQKEECKYLVFKGACISKYMNKFLELKLSHTYTCKMILCP